MFRKYINVLYRIARKKKLSLDNNNIPNFIRLLRSDIVRIGMF